MSYWKVQIWFFLFEFILIGSLALPLVPKNNHISKEHNQKSRILPTTSLSSNCVEGAKSSTTRSDLAASFVKENMDQHLPVANIDGISRVDKIIHDNSFLSSEDGCDGLHLSETKTKTVLLILNTPGLSKELVHSQSLFQKLWDISSVRVCADGGANRLFDAVKHHGEQMQYIPDFIKGDLDSLRGDVREFYENLGCAIEKDPDQDTNDLDKCLQAIFERQTSNSVNYAVCVYGAFGGRFDQEMASINALYRWQNKFSRLLLFTEETSAFLLPANVLNEVILNEDLEGPVCGLIPIGASAKSVHTSGLKWNLNGDTSEFGGMVSSSNQVESGKKVTIQTSAPLIWTTEINL